MLCIVHIWLAMSLRSLYHAHSPQIMRRQAAVIQFSFGLMGAIASMLLYSEDFDKFEKS